LSRKEAEVQDYRKLQVWQRAQETCVAVYRFTADFPVEERYGMTAQLRRAGVSVGANLAEGAKRKSPIDKARIFNLALGEAAEAMSLLDLAVRLQFGRKAEAERLVCVYDELLAMIASLCQKVA
jgi:four helix bundle protein